MLLTTLLTALQLASPAFVLAAEGDATALVPDKTLPLARGVEVPAGAIVSTGKGSRVSLRLASGSLVTLGAETQVLLNELEHTARAGERQEGLRLLAGRVWAKVTRLFGKSHFTIDSQNAVAGVRGTEFGIVQEGGTTTFVLGHGAIDVTLGGTRFALLEPGATATLTAGFLAMGGVLSPGEVQKLSAGAGSFDAGVAFGPEPGADLGASPQRQLLGPDVLIDSAVGLPSTGGPGPAFLDVTVELR